MKKINITYWIVTGLFAAFMTFTAIPDLFPNKDVIDFMHVILGYPEYFIPFIGVAKILGSIAILVPGFTRLKEWAYAGLMFDLVGAAYSVMAVAGKDGLGGLAFMLALMAVCMVSYFLHHKRMKTTI